MLGYLFYITYARYLPDMHAICDGVLDSCFTTRISDDALSMAMCERTFHFSQEPKESISEDCGGFSLPCKLGKGERLVMFYESRV